MKYYDQHNHSHHSEDAAPSLCEMAACALKNGLTGFTTTDHFDLCSDPIGYPYYLEHETERMADFAAAKEQFGESLELRWGLEVGNPYLMPEIAEELLRDRKFDFVLGSVHYLHDGRDVYLGGYDTPAEQDEMFKMYFDDMLTLVRDWDFDSLAHLDYPLRVMEGKCEPTVLPWRDRIEAVLEELVRKDRALEVNTRGYMGWRNRQEPEEWVLRRYQELGGRFITVGSDAHKAELIGFAADQAYEVIRRLGFEGVAVYTGRKPEIIPFD